MVSRADARVQLGLVGLGWWGGELARATEESGVARVVTCFARDPASRSEFAAARGCRPASSLDELLSDPEVEGVLIATSHLSHRDLVEQTAAANKHIFVEKPLTTTVADGRACVEAAAEAGVVLQVGHQSRRTAANRRIKEMLDAGEIGDVEIVVAHQSTTSGFRLADEAWRWSPEQSPLGSMTSLGVHKIDTMHYLIGPIVRVSALSRPGRERPIDEATVLAFEFENGALATLTTTFFMPVVNQIAVFGTLAAAFNTMGGSRLSVQRRDAAEPTDVELRPVDPVVDEIVGFARAIRGEGPIEPDGESALAVIAVLEAAVESVETGRAVDVLEAHAGRARPQRT